MENLYFSITEKIFDKIQNSKNIIITTHTNPDGDAIGSSLGLYHYLKSINKNVNIIIDNQVPFNVEFLDENNLIKVFDTKRDYELFLNVDLIFILDLNDSKRLKSMEEYILNSNAYKIMIDHHLDPQKFYNCLLSDTSATSTGELIWYYFYNNKIEIPKKSAEALFVAIMTDTGNFRHNRTDAEAFYIASDLIRYGADPVELYDKVYNVNSLSGIRLLGEALRSIELYFKDKVSVMTITSDILQATGAGQDDIEGFVEKTLSIKGTEIGILLADISEKNEIRMSFRSKNNYSARDIANAFGGGGHFNAAGARQKNISIEKARDNVLNKINELFEF